MMATIDEVRKMVAELRYKITEKEDCMSTDERKELTDIVDTIDKNLNVIATVLAVELSKLWEEAKKLGIE